MKHVHAAVSGPPRASTVHGEGWHTATCSRSAKQMRPGPPHGGGTSLQKALVGDVVEEGSSCPSELSFRRQRLVQAPCSSSSRKCAGHRGALFITWLVLCPSPRQVPQRQAEWQRSNLPVLVQLVASLSRSRNSVSCGRTMRHPVNACMPFRLLEESELGLTFYSV